MPKLTAVVSTFSRDDSETKSNHSSKSNKKINKEKVNSFARPKNVKAYVKNQSPRA